LNAGEQTYETQINFKMLNVDLKTNFDNIPPLITCSGDHVSNVYILEGGCIPGKMKYYCNECVARMDSTNIVSFKNEKVIIESKFTEFIHATNLNTGGELVWYTIAVSDAQSDGNVLKPHTKMRRIGEIKSKCGRKKIWRLRAVMGKVSSESNATIELNDIAEIKPGDIINIQPGFAIQVTDGFVDPRRKEREKKE